MNKKLFLIGNGFDIAHNLKTRYLDFMVWMYKFDKPTLIDFSRLLLQNFLKINGYLFEDDWRYNRPINKVDKRIKEIDQTYIKKTEEYLILDEISLEPLILYVLWESLEEYMYYVFLDDALSEVEMERKCLLETLEAEEYGTVIESDLDDLYRPALETFNKLISLADKFKYDLLRWVDNIDDITCEIQNNIELNENNNGENSINMLPDDFFGYDNFIINFNYSNTIEQFYSQKVWHIHGSNFYTNPPIMGHTVESKKFNRYDENELILVNKFYKNYHLLIDNYSHLFKKFTDVNEIIVLGLGYTDVDYPYFEEISKLATSANWHFYYYNENDKTNAEKYVEKLNLKRNNYKMISIKEKSPFTKTIKYSCYNY